MTIVPIYNSSGIQVNELTVPDDISYVNGRVSKGSKGYYKGVGVPYKSHNMLEPNLLSTDEYTIGAPSGVFYLGSRVVKHAFKGKTGIFMERYQPFFPDYIGTCSVKEGIIVINTLQFERSSIEILDCVHFDEVNGMYYYVIDYKCGRKRYLTDGGQPKLLLDLLDYMLANNWNFLWDKGAINDITNDGRVSDTADLFADDSLVSRIGTVYSVLYSLGRQDFKAYTDLIRVAGMHHMNDMSYVFNSLNLLQKFGVDVSPAMINGDAMKIYKHVISNFLLPGKNCAYCACNLYKDAGDKVRDQYIEMFRKSHDSV